MCGGSETLGATSGPCSQSELALRCSTVRLVEKAMREATHDLPEPIERQAERILREIETAGSMILAVKSGARAQGFILGITCCDGLPTERCELLSAYFDSIVEQRLKSLTLGLEPPLNR